MAEILGKDLDKWDDSLAARRPFALKESNISGPQYLTGSDFVRSAKISPEWKLPVNNQIPKVAQPIITMGEAVVDTVVNYAPNLKNVAAQRAIELTTGEEIPETVAGRLTKGTEIGRLQDDVARIIGLGMIGADALINRKEYEEKAKTYDEAVELVNNRDYPLTKYARRVLAETTNQVETRRVVRELYNQSRGIDSSAWYNQAGSIIGAMIPTIVVSRGVGATARAFGAGRISATNAALNATKGIVAGQMAGDYAEETAAEYLERTGDTTFENFTAKDATGLSAMAYGAIAGQIEVLGGIEPIMAGAVSKVGLRSGLLKAGVKVGLQEAAEEFLQGMAEFFTRKIDRSTEKTWGEAFKEALTGAVWGLFIGGPMGTGAFYINRRNLTKGIKKALPNISDTQATQVADAMIDNAAESSSQDPTLRNNLREKVALMYRDIDMDNKDDRIDAMTDLEYSLIAMDAIDRGIDIADHELFQGVVNELGWFRAGIPEAEKGKIESINNNIRELRTQLEELNKAEEKDWAKIEEIENKLKQASQYVLENLTDVRKAFQELEDKYVEKEFKATPKQIELSGKTATDIFDTLSNEGVDIQFANQGKTTKDAATYLQINRKGAKSFQIRFGVSAIGPLHPSVVANFNVETLTQEQILQHIRTLIENKYPRTNKKAKEGVNIGFGEEPMFQPEQFDLADENARLDDIYPEYTGETIEVDGKERTVYNSNGDRIAKSKEALTNFWRWFGDSKVVDEQGRPLVVYHGTNAEFDTFNETLIGKWDYGFYGKGFYFTDAKHVAEDYAKSGAFDDGGTATVMPVYLNLQNPFFMDYRNDNGISDEKHNRLVEQGYDGVIAIESRDLRKEGYEEELNKAKALNVEHWQLKDYEGNVVGRILPFEYVAWKSNQIKSVDNRGTYSEKTGNIYWQNRVSGAAPKTYRGAYIPEYRFILRANKMDASTLSHELAHDWMEVNFARYREGKASKDFMKAWGALEKALGIPEDATSVPRKASEAFARAYEAWIVQNEDWAKFIAVEDKDKDAVEKLMKDYQGELRDIYNDITSPYFKQTWGKIGELKPELKAWFDRVVNITDLDTMVERGEMTESQAANEKLNRAIDTVIENTTDEETKQALTEAKVLNDTSRYEVEGGNKNSIQQRLSILAKDIDENNMVLKGEKYDTHRDMMQVAEAADNFVKTRLDDALAIINGEMAETEGLYKEDLYTALERLAVENGDLNLIDELKNSEVANRLAKELGQRVAGFRNIKQSTDIDVVSALKSLDMKFNKALDNKKAKQEYDAALKLLDESMKQQDKIADKELDNFLKELECK